MQWSAVVSLLPYHHKNAAVLLILLQNWIHSYQNWVNCQKHTGCLCKIILKTNCCGSTGKWKKAMEHLTPRYPIAVAETLDDFSTITAIVFRFPNAISYLETYLLDHISLQKKIIKEDVTPWRVPHPFLLFMNISDKRLGNYVGRIIFSNYRKIQMIQEWKLFE